MIQINVLNWADWDFFFTNFWILVHEIIKVLTVLSESWKIINLKILSNSWRNDYKFSEIRKKIYFVINSEITGPIFGNFATTWTFFKCVPFWCEFSSLYSYLTSVIFYFLDSPTFIHTWYKIENSQGLK